MKDTPGPGASKKVVWPRLYIGTIIKRTEKRRVREVIRRMSHGKWRKAKKLLKASKSGKKLNTGSFPDPSITFEREEEECSKVQVKKLT